MSDALVKEYRPLIRPFMSYHEGQFSLTYTNEKGQVFAMELPEDWAARLQLSIAEAFKLKAEERLGPSSANASDKA